MAEVVSAAAAALQLDNRSSLLRFVRNVLANQSDPSTLRLYEHRNGQFSIHGPADVALAAQLGADDLRAVSELPPVPPVSQNPLETLFFNFRIARDLASAALFSSGKKAEVYFVAADGRASLRLNGSPGNLGSLEDGFLDPDAPRGGLNPGLAQGNRHVLDDGAVLSVRFASQKSLTVMGICAWDAAKRTMHVSEIYEDDVFSNLESIIVATNAKEAVFSDSDMSAFDKAKLIDVIEKCGVAMTLQKRSKFNPANAQVDLERLVGSNLEIAKYLDKKTAVSAIAGLTDYLLLMADPNLEGKVKILDLGTASYMQLDNAAMRALNILPFPGDGGKKGSLFGLLNVTKSAMGARLLRRWLSQPLQDVEEINTRLDITAALIEAAESCRSIREEHVNKLPDLNLLCKRFTKNNGAKASLQDVVRLYQCSIRLPFLCDRMEGPAVDKVVPDRYSTPLRKLIKELANFEALVETTIDLDQIDNGEFVVSPAVDPELKELRQQQDAILADINSEYQHVSGSISGLKSESLKLERKDNLGYIFRLTRKEEKLIRGKHQFNILETRKDGVRFQTRKLRRLSEGYETVANEYSQKETEMRGKTLEVAGTYVEVFLDVAALLAEIDVLCSFATVAVEARSSYCRPVLKPAGTGLELKQARHPIVEESMEDDAEFIANDLDLTRTDDGARENEVTGGSLLLVTGPNMGGKSTYIRCAGLLTLMAHIGCYVPAEEASVPITDRIFARVGAGDNQHRAISTFMSEMLETAAILRSATARSLVIIDELGRGTGTTDGYGLAYSISKHLATELRSACLFATHFFELTALADSVQSVKNVHVSAVTDPRSNKLTFLYEVQPGACDQSFGVHVAEMAHFPASVVNAAKRKAAELEGSGIPAKKLKTSAIAEEDIAAGRKLVNKFLKDIRELPTSSESELNESVEKARGLRQRVLAEKNPYIIALLESESAA